jgi:hypothetical protein
MARRRTRSIGTKVTESEYVALEAMAGEQRLSEWVRQVLLAAVRSVPAEPVVVLAELLALRTILLNLHFAVTTGASLSADDMRQLIERADEDKWQKAEERLLSAIARRRR